MSSARIKSIVDASILRGDDIHVTVEKQLEANEISTLPCHRSCVSTYTLKHHIERSRKHLMKEKAVIEPPEKRTRSSTEQFSFHTDCFLCGQSCEERSLETLAKDINSKKKE